MTEMPTKNSIVTLREVTRDNLREVLRLHRQEDHEHRPGEPRQHAGGRICARQRG